MGLLDAVKPSSIDANSWKTVVVIAGLGTILEYYDFYCYSQLSAVLGKVFFPSTSADAQALSYWGVFAVAFVARPIGALIFGHIGDKFGRRWTFATAISVMATATLIIGILPTNHLGSYRAGIAAPILLAILRFFQGVAFAGDFGAAVVYISELAEPNLRGRMVSTLQWAVNIGLILASIVVIILQAALTEQQMLLWGWRIPFLLAAVTAILGYYMRRGLPETNAFLKEQSKEEHDAALRGGHAEAPAPKAAAAAAADAKVIERSGSGEADAALEIDDPAVTNIKRANSFASTTSGEEAEADVRVQGVLTGLHGHSSSSVPVLRLLKNNAFGLIANLCFGAWVYGAFFVAVTWLNGTIINAFKVNPNVALGILIVSLLFNTAGLSSAGYALDKGLRPITAGLINSTIGVALGLGMYKWIGGKSLAALWIAPSLMHYFIGIQMALIVMPMTRIYYPLERTTGFSFAYGTGYGLLGGISPLVVTAWKAKLPIATASLAPGLWLLLLYGFTVLGFVLLKLYLPRLDQPFVGRIR